MKQHLAENYSSFVSLLFIEIRVDLPYCTVLQGSLISIKIFESLRLVTSSNCVSTAIILQYLFFGPVLPYPISQHHLHVLRASFSRSPRSTHPWSTEGTYMFLGLLIHLFSRVDTLGSGKYICIPTYTYIQPRQLISPFTILDDLPIFTSQLRGRLESN